MVSDYFISQQPRVKGQASQITNINDSNNVYIITYYMKISNKGGPFDQI